MTTKSNEKHLTKKELVSAFWRSFMVTACFSMDRMQAAGFDFAMIPVLKKLYGDNKEKYSEAPSSRWKPKRRSTFPQVYSHT